ncbi:RDD family protein [Mesoterricola sediminis]|uniref:RDD family protein n=1 Tax=Mesoterricola sediminis TaxID=2927980 RepID=UPI001FAE8CDB|nr:RDD family protein [Mesoterricola sediminis]
MHPGQLPEGTPLAPFWRRFLALLADLGILLAAWLPLALLVALALSRGAAGHAPHRDIVLAANAGPGSWVFLPLALGYFTLGTWLGHGRTLGKRLLGIRVVPLEHPHLTFWACLERTLGYFASMLEGGFGFLQFFIHPNRQTVHDRIAETVVIRQ